MFAHEFMRNAFLAGTFVALACGLVGYFVVLRSQVFAGDALSHVAFTGALAAAAAGIDIRLGLFAATIVVGARDGAARRASPRRRRRDRLRLRLGARPRRPLPLDLHQRLQRRKRHRRRPRPLRLDPRPLSRRRPARRGDRARSPALALLAIARPLLFASLDPDVARGLGVPVRALGSASSSSSRSSPPRRPRPSARCCCSACSRRRPARPGCSPTIPGGASALSAAIAVASMWVGLALSYEVASLPPSTAVIGDRDAPSSSLAALRSRLSRPASVATRRRPSRWPLGSKHDYGDPDELGRARPRVLAEAGYRRGGARTAVVEELARHDCAVTALDLDDELRRRKPAVGRASVYRALEQLEELGLVQRIEVCRGSRRL